MWTIAHSSGDGILPPHLGYLKKQPCGFRLGLSFSLTLGEASGHVVRTLRHPVEMATLGGTEGPANS